MAKLRLSQFVRSSAGMWNESFVSKFPSSSSLPAAAIYHSRTRSNAISKKFSPLLKLSQVPFLWDFMIPSVMLYPISLFGKSRKCLCLYLFPVPGTISGSERAQQKFVEFVCSKTIDWACSEINAMSSHRQDNTTLGGSISHIWTSSSCKFGLRKKGAL